MSSHKSGMRFHRLVCWLARRYVFVTLRYPSFKSAFMSQHRHLIQASEDELAEFEAHSSGRHVLASLIMMVFFFVCSLRNFTFVLLAFTDFDHLRPEVSLRQQWTQAGGSNSASASLASFACLVTNCSRLSARLDNGGELAAASLAADFSRLPIFPLCHPAYDVVMSPTARIGPPGMLVLGATGYLVLLNGTLIGFVRLFLFSSAAAHDEALMFTFAPSASIRLTVARIRQLLVDLEVSYRNFHASRLMESMVQAAAARGLGGVGGGQLQLQLRTTKAATSYQYLQQRQQQVSLLQVRANDERRGEGADANDEARLFDELLPLVRSHWWHGFITRHFSRWILLGFGTLISVIGIIIGGFELKSREFKQLFGEYEQTTRELGCAIWRQVGPAEAAANSGRANGERPPGGPRPLDLSESVELRWTPWSLAETTLINVLPNFAAILLWVYYYVIIAELACWLAELRLSLLAALTASRYHESAAGEASPRACGTPTGLHPSARPDSMHGRYSLNQLQQRPPPQAGQPTVDLVKLKARFRDELDFQCLIWFVRRFPGSSTTNSINKKFNDSLEVRRLLEELESTGAPGGVHGGGSGARRRQTNFDLKQQQQQRRRRQLAPGRDGEHLCVETLERIYINFRLFMHHTKSSEGLFTLITVVIYMFNYGLVLIAVFFSQRTPSISSLEPAALIGFGFMLSNLFISLAANFHANTRKLQILVWSLIAQLAKSDQVRVQHIRSLWTKQLVALDLEGDGIALKAASIRITYVNIIQTVIWVGTILVIALKPN